MKTYLAVLPMLLFLGCKAPPAPTPAHVQAPLVINPSPLAIAHRLASFPDGQELDGIACDQRLCITVRTQHATASPPPDVLVASRLTHDPLGSITPPPGGWVGPTGVEMLDFETNGFATSGHILAFDNNSLPPSPSIKVYRYSYAHDPAHGLSSTLEATYNVPLQTAQPPTINGLVFLSDVLTIPVDGVTVLNDPAVGALWTCNPSFACTLAMVDPDFAPAPSPQFTGIGRAPGGGTRPYTLDLTVGLSPGVVGSAYIAATDQVCVGRTAQPGGVWCIDRAVLESSASPFTKTKHVIVPPTPGVSDGGHGMSADRNNSSSPWLYWARSYSDAPSGNLNKVFRVNVQTLEVQTVLADNTLLDFSTGVTVMPPLDDGGLPVVPLAVPMGQEEFNGLLNADLHGVDDFVAPTLITEIDLVTLH